MTTPDQPSESTLSEILHKHIIDAEGVLRELRDWQKQLDGKVDKIASELARNTAVCDEMRSYQIAGRVVSRVFRWFGTMAMAAGGMIGLWIAIKAAFGSHPPGPGPGPQ